MEEKIIVIKGDTSDADKKVKGLDKGVGKLNKNLSGTKKASNEAGQSLDKVSGGAIGKFKTLKGSVVGVASSFKSLKFAIIASGIGALLIAVIAVGKAFTNSEEGQNKFAKLMGVIGSVTGNFVDILASLGEKIIGVFEDPKKAISDFAKLIKEDIINRFNGLIELVPQIGKAVKQLFTLDFSGAAETAANAVAKVALGTNDLTGSIRGAGKALKELAMEVASDAAIAADIADKRAKADKLDRELITERAQATRDIAELRLKSEQKDKFAVAERIKFLQEANAIEEETTDKSIKSAKLRRDAIIEENKLSGSTKEDLDAEAQAKARIISLDTSRLNLSKRLETRLVALRSEEVAGAKKIANEKQKELEKEESNAIKKAEAEAKTEGERLNKIAQIQDDFRKRREDEEANTEVLKLELEKERKILELEALGAEEEEKANIILFYQEKINKARTDAEQLFLTEKQRINNEILNNERETELESQNIKLKALDDLTSIAGAETKVGQALIIAKNVLLAKELIIEASKTLSFATQAGARSTIAVAEGVAQTAKVGFPQNIPLLIGYAAQAAGIISAISSATSSAKAGAVGGGSTGGGGAQRVQAPTAPSFNLVQGTDSNQIAQSINQGNQTPIQAFVVGDAVTSQQQLDRNKINIGSI